MQERVYRTLILDVADLNRRLIAAWSGLQHHVVTQIAVLYFLCIGLLQQPYL